MHWPAVACAAAAVCVTVWLLLQRNSRDAHAEEQGKHKPLSGRQQQQQQQRQQSEPAGQRTAKKTGSSNSSSSSTRQGDSRPPDIPQQELQQLQSFLRKVYNWRGWQGGAYHITQAWQAVMAAAVTPAGGSWQEQFTGKQLTDANCDALLSVIDTHFCAGKLLKRMKSPASGSPCTQAPSTQPGSSIGCSAISHTSSSTLTSEAGTDASHVTHAAAADSSSRALRCRVVQSWDATWLAYFDTQDNTVYINCWRWAKEVSPDAPINCEGVVCVNRLQLLVHTLAHELVHAVVFHLFPDIDAHSPAYTVNSRHGPIFNLLNKQMFGHTSAALEHVHGMTGRSCV